MILEQVYAHITEGQEEAYATAVREGAWVIESAPGCHGLSAHRQVENPSIFVLWITWDSVEAHMAFRETDLYTDWKARTHGFYQYAPTVTHFSESLPR